MSDKEKFSNNELYKKEVLHYYLRFKNIMLLHDLSCRTSWLLHVSTVFYIDFT